MTVETRGKTAVSAGCRRAGGSDEMRNDRRKRNFVEMSVALLRLEPCGF